MMPMRSVQLRGWLWKVMVLGLIVSGLVGCGIFNRKSAKDRRLELQITAIPNNSAVDLSPRDVVSLMRASGFVDKQIYEYGPDFRQALLEFGGAQIAIGEGQVEAMYKVQGDLVWVTTMTRGNFVYDVKAGQFRMGPKAQSQQRYPARLR